MHMIKLRYARSPLIERMAICHHASSTLCSVSAPLQPLLLCIVATAAELALPPTAMGVFSIAPQPSFLPHWAHATNPGTLRGASSVASSCVLVPMTHIVLRRRYCRRQWRWLSFLRLCSLSFSALWPLPPSWHYRQLRWVSSQLLLSLLFFRIGPMPPIQALCGVPRLRFRRWQLG